jgi:hypothetical protein
VPKIPLVFNALCQLITLDISFESETENQIAIEWEQLRTEIADTVTQIAKQGV